MKRKLICLLLTLAILAALPVMTLAADGDVTIDESNFPDSIFRDYVKQFDTDSDGILSKAEREAVTHINVYNMGISDLTGIACFPNLAELLCHDNKLTRLNVSSNTKLTYLACVNNQINALGLSNLTRPEELACYNNPLISLELNCADTLKLLSAYGTHLTALDLTGYSKLTNLIVEGLTSLNVKGCTALKILRVNDGSLTNLDLKTEDGYLDITSKISQQTASVTANCIGTLDLSGLGKVSQMKNITGGTLEGNILTLNADATQVTYDYDTGVDYYYGDLLVPVKLNVTAAGHDIQPVTAVPAECENPGNHAYYACDDCGSCWMDAAGEIPTTAQAESIPALGHDHSLLQGDASGHWQQCANGGCTDALAAEKHDMKQGDKFTQNGTEYYKMTCSVCGYEGEPALTPATGDTTPVALLAVMMLLSAGAIPALRKKTRT